MEKLIKAAGSELINRAGELAEGVESFTDLDIWIRFREEEVSYIDVTKRYANTEMIKVLCGEE